MNPPPTLDSLFHFMEEQLHRAIACRDAGRRIDMRHSARQAVAVQRRIREIIVNTLPWCWTPRALAHMRMDLKTSQIEPSPALIREITFGQNAFTPSTRVPGQRPNLLRYE